MYKYTQNITVTIKATKIIIIFFSVFIKNFHDLNSLFLINRSLNTETVNYIFFSSFRFKRSNLRLF